MSMKRSLFVGVAGLVAVFLSVLAIRAQDKPAPKIPDYTRAALLDVNKIFKEHAGFDAAMKKIKDDADEMDKKMKETETSLRTKSLELQKMSPGSPEYAELEESIAHATADFRLNAQVDKRKFLQREAVLYQETYEELEKIVNDYSQSHRINLVMRFTNNDVDSKNPESILAHLNQPIVSHKEYLDITPDIQKIIDEKHPKAPTEEKKSEEKKTEDKKPEEKKSEEKPQEEKKAS
jgi:Skp family chaperone for outer membrane proteins